MAELETSSRAGRDSDKTNKPHKYTPDKVLQARLEFDDERYYSNLPNNGSAYAEISIQRLQPATICFCS